MHSPADFTEHCLGLLKNRGTSGPTGPASDKLFKSRDKAGTTDYNEVGPLSFHWSQQIGGSGPAKSLDNQGLAKPVTTGTTGTTIFARAIVGDAVTDLDYEWHAILQGLSATDPADGFSNRHWNSILEDGRRFLDSWSEAARNLGWTSLDLFGVHPAAPSTRIGSWGLLLLLRGGDVVALTDQSATIRRPSRSTLTYPRHPISSEILLSEVKHAAT